MDITRTMDINCDLGEGMPNDAELMPFISSCNIACGGHFGSKETIRTTVRLAQKHGVKVGAHPSYPDKENFGRKSMTISPSELKESLRTQIFDFLSVCDEEEIEPNHIKLHGALYNDTEKHSEIANVISELTQEIKLALPFYLSPNSLLKEKVNTFWVEAFIDRRYEDDGSLVSRSHPNSLIEDSVQAWQQLERMIFRNELSTINGKNIPMKARTFCIHGDTHNALTILRFIDSKLKGHNIFLDKNG